jgi:hypothetical protein
MTQGSEGGKGAKGGGLPFPSLRCVGAAAVVSLEMEMVGVADTLDAAEESPSDCSATITGPVPSSAP